MRISLLLLLAFSGLSFISSAQSLSKKEKQILALVDKNIPESIQLLEQVVNINSGTNNIAGVQAVGKIFREQYNKIGFETRWIDMPMQMKRGGHLFAEHKGTKGKRLLLIGHLDTVFEPDSPFQKWSMVDSIVSGPGANDMKGGDVIMLYALKALADAGAIDKAQIIVALHGDEENSGDPDEISRRDIIDAAKRSDYALGFETATGFEYGTIARRGASEWVLEVTGKRAHSSAVFSKNVGAGAIYETARILQEFYETLPEQYLTFNPGLIVGGSATTMENGEGTASGKTNVVAETAKVHGDLRFISEEQKEKARKKMAEIVAHHNLPQTSAKITFKDGIPSMPPTDGNYKLLSVLSKVSIDMGLGEVKPWDPGQRGAGDISYVAPYVSGVDGLGCTGSGAHSLNETMDLKTFKNLTRRAALFIYRLTQEK
jgi:glutamate carboxypeptidase